VVAVVPRCGLNGESRLRICESEKMKHVGLPIQGQVAQELSERFSSSPFRGPLREFNGNARITGPCGDTMELWINVIGEYVDDASFATSGCGPSMAAGMMAAKLAKGKELSEAASIEQADILAALGGLPKESEHCASLASNVLKAAVDDYMKKAVAREPAP